MFSVWLFKRKLRHRRLVNTNICIDKLWWERIVLVNRERVAVLDTWFVAFKQRSLDSCIPLYRKILCFILLGRDISAKPRWPRKRSRILIDHQLQDKGCIILLLLNQKKNRSRGTEKLWETGAIAKDWETFASCLASKLIRSYMVTKCKYQKQRGTMRQEYSSRNGFDRRSTRPRLSYSLQSTVIALSSMILDSTRAVFISKKD